MSKKPPEKLVVMGRVAAPFGVKGLIKVQPFTAATKSLLAYDRWWFGRDGEWREYEIERAQVQGRSVVAKIKNCHDRDGALEFRGRQIAIPRAAFPRTAENEFYWADLIGLRVVNGEARDFGRVSGILETGANDVLVVQGERERLIPFIANVIKDVDFGHGMISVDWSADF